jgi:integrase/recombinase XerD
MAHVGSFREAFEDFIEDKLYQGARPATIHFYRSNVEHVLRDTGITSLEALTLQEIRRWLLEHKDLSPNSLATYDRCLRVFCNWLEKRGYVSESPMRNLPKRQPKRTVIETLSRDDLHAILNRCRKSSVAAGCRVDSIAGGFWTVSWVS